MVVYVCGGDGSVDSCCVVVVLVVVVVIVTSGDSCGICGGG